MVTPDVIIRKVDDGSNERVLKVTWSNGRLSRFPYVFLRENCKCNECFHPSSKQRLIDTVRDVDLNLKLIKQATVSVDGATLRCEWPDGHRSVYSANWLYERLMPEEDERRAKLEDAGGLVRDELILWGNERMQDNIPRYEYEAVMNDDKTLFDYLFTLYQYGLIVVENAPARSGVSAKLAARIGYHKSTHYG